MAANSIAYKHDDLLISLRNIDFLSSIPPGPKHWQSHMKYSFINTGNTSIIISRISVTIDIPRDQAAPLAFARGKSLDSVRFTKEFNPPKVLKSSDADPEDDFLGTDLDDQFDHVVKNRHGIAGRMQISLNYSSPIVSDGLAELPPSTVKLIVNPDNDISVSVDRDRIKDLIYVALVNNRNFLGIKF